MIIAQNVCMYYPVAKKYIHYLTKPFKDEYFTALKNVSIDIKAGDRVAFLGTNGAGKTTLLKLIGGLLYPSSGIIKVNEFDTVKQNSKARKDVGFVLNEERSFYWRLTGEQNLNFFGALDNMHGKLLKDEIDLLINLVGLKDARNKLFAGYSSGMKQRLAIARGLLSNPSILVLDEPTRTLDPVSAYDVKNILSKRIHGNKVRTLLIATHSLKEAEALCNKLCFMKKGEIILYATTKQVIDQFGSIENCYKILYQAEEAINEYN